MAKRKPVKATEKPARASEPGAGDSSSGPIATPVQSGEAGEQGSQQPATSAPAASGPDSDVATEQDTEPGQAQDAAQAAPQAMGNVHGLPTASDGPISYHRTRERLMKHAEWGHIIGTVKEMRIDPKLAKMRAEHRERFIWGEMDRLYPAAKAQSVALLKTDSPQVDTGNDLQKKAESPPVRDAGVKGLGDLPSSWPALPANASLAAEVAWVQANRLYVVEEKPSGATVVRLERAHEPAPSRAAIGWLETSVRSYAKFVEVAAKVSSSGVDDQANTRRERMAIEEIRSILSQMQG